MRLAAVDPVDQCSQIFDCAFVRIVRSRRGVKSALSMVQPWAHDGAPQRDVGGAARRFSCGSGVQSAPGNRGDGVCGLLWRSSRSPRRRPAAPG